MRQTAVMDRREYGQPVAPVPAGGQFQPRTDGSHRVGTVVVPDLRSGGGNATPARCHQQERARGRGSAYHEGSLRRGQNGGQTLLYGGTAHRNARGSGGNCPPCGKSGGILLRESQPPQRAAGYGDRQRFLLHSEAVHGVPVGAAGHHGNAPREAGIPEEQDYQPPCALSAPRRTGQPGRGGSGARRPTAERRARAGMPGGLPL